MASPSSKPYDLEITIISAKHLKNVNWRNGILKPYCIFRVDPDRWLSTKSDDSGSTKPVWNEKFTLPLPSPPQDSHLTLEIFHSKPSETPKPLVGTLSLNLRDLFVDDLLLTPLKNFDLLRPSGRPHGQVRLKLALRHRAAQNYQNTATAAPAPAPALNPHQPQHSYYYSSAPPAPPPRDYRGYSSNSSIHEATAPSHNPYHYGGSGGYGSYYQGYYPQQAPSPQPPRPVFERQASYLGPSALVDRPVFERQASYGGPGPSAPVDRPVFERQASYGGSGPSAPVDRPVFERQASYGGSGPSAPVDRPVFERQASYGGPSAPVDRPVFERQDGRPSAPVDYMAYDHKRGGGSKAGWGSGLGVRAMAGAFGGLALDGGIKYEDDKISERVESESVAKDGYGNYRVDY